MEVWWCLEFSLLQEDLLEVSSAVVEPCVDLGSPLQGKNGSAGCRKGSDLGILWLVTLGPQMCAVKMDFLSSCAPYKGKLCRSMHLLVQGSEFGVSRWDISSCWSG